jgi:pectate lyase
MKRTVTLSLRAVLAMSVAAAVIGAPSLMSTASAAPVATGFATQNGGTTGGTGGQTVRATTGTQIHQALCGRASNSTPIIIEVVGTINHANTSKVSGSCNTAADVIEIKDVSNVTLVGVGAGATFDQLGIHIRNSSNIIIQNVTVKNVKKSGSPVSNGGDAIGMESTVSNVLVDHATLEASGGESEGYDGLFDMKAGTRYVTLSYSILRNSGRGGLVGSSDSDLANGPITYHHNLYQNIDSRTPLLRGATAHIYNNYYENLVESGINPRAGGKARVDNNYFKDSKDVLGTFYTDLPGYWQVSGNVFDNVTWSAKSSDNNPAGPDPVSNTTVSIPYSFQLDAANCVPAVVAGTAGANTGLKVSDGSCSVTAPTTPTVTATPTVSPTPSATPTATVSPTGSPSPTGPPAAGLSCTTRTDAWSGGFVTSVTIANTGTAAVNGWRVSLQYDRAVSVAGVWGASATASGSTVTAQPVSWTSTIAAAGSQSFGLQGTTTGTAVTPTCAVA